METRQLEYFVAVAEELSFTRAAQRLLTGQSTVSAGVRALESELDTALFERSTRRVALTPAGVSLLPEAKAALNAIDRARLSVRLPDSGLHGRLRIATTGCRAVDLPKTVAVFKERHPQVDVRLTVSAGNSLGLVEEVKIGSLDLAMVDLPRSELGGLVTRVIQQRPYVVVLPPGHRYADRAELSLMDLKDEDFVDAPRGFGSRMVIDRAYDALDVRRNVVAEVADLRLAESYVDAGIGVAVAPDACVSEGMVVRPIAGAELSWSLSVVALRLSPAVRAVLAVLEEHS
ncbi:LysR family transcriptional regulator [Actinocrispum sp. NPDC049592]|uniref:LysR family transcriptional regulator n=1 Tax=Actinocrispum sp. NPDC049592 TaxID=3154835 RepID=UPI00344700B7